MGAARVAVLLCASIVVALFPGCGHPTQDPTHPEIEQSGGYDLLRVFEVAGRQGIAADDGDAEDDEADNLWRVTAETGSTAAYVTHEKTFTEFRKLGEIEGIDFDREAGEMLVLANRGKRIVFGMPKGLYPGYEREIHEVYVYRTPRAVKR